LPVSQLYQPVGFAPGAHVLFSFKLVLGRVLVIADFSYISLP